MLAEYLSKQMVDWKVPFLIKVMISVMTFKRNLLSKKNWEFKYYENIEGVKEFDINKDALNFSKRKNGISLFARLKNGEEFLEATILSQEPFFDEIILVDNNSTDKTKEICKKLVLKFSNKIKFFEYTSEVYPVWHEKWAETKDDSVHALSYYYNWTLSKTTYKYVAKLDDDVVTYDEKLLKSITDNIRKIWINYLQIIPQLNVSNINWELMTPISQPNSKILPPIAWLYLDHWIFPISEKTYFINGKTMETFIFPFWAKISKIWFMHLKWMKNWIKNWKWDMKKLVENINNNSSYINLPSTFKNKLSKWINIKDYQ